MFAEQSRGTLSQRLITTLKPSPHLWHFPVLDTRCRLGLYHDRQFGSTYSIKYSVKLAVMTRAEEYDTKIRGNYTNVEPALLVALKSVHHLNENRGCSQKPQRSEQTKRKLFFDGVRHLMQKRKCRALKKVSLFSILRMGFWLGAQTSMARGLS